MLRHYAAKADTPPGGAVVDNISRWLVETKEDKPYGQSKEIDYN
jgi:hypothetical protein